MKKKKNKEVPKIPDDYMEKKWSELENIFNLQQEILYYQEMLREKRRELEEKYKGDEIDND